MLVPGRSWGKPGRFVNWYAHIYIPVYDRPGGVGLWTFSFLQSEIFTTVSPPSYQFDDKSLGDENWGSRRNWSESHQNCRKREGSIETALAENILRMRWWNLLILKNSKNTHIVLYLYVKKIQRWRNVWAFQMELLKSVLFQKLFGWGFFRIGCIKLARICCSIFF